MIAFLCSGKKMNVFIASPAIVFVDIWEVRRPSAQEWEPFHYGWLTAALAAVLYNEQLSCLHQRHLVHSRFCAGQPPILAQDHRWRTNSPTTAWLDEKYQASGRSCSPDNPTHSMNTKLFKVRLPQAPILEKNLCSPSTSILDPYGNSRPFRVGIGICCLPG